MPNIKDVAPKLFGVSDGNVPLSLIQILIIVKALSLLSHLLGKFLSPLEPHLLWVIQAHLSNCINEALLACGVEEVFQVEAANRELLVLCFFGHLVLLHLAHDFVARCNGMFFWVEVKPTKELACILLWRPPGVGNWLQEILYTYKDFLWHFVEAWLSRHLKRNIKISRIPDDKEIR